MNKLKTLNKNQLWQLRQEIVLNSLFLNDYENSFGIDKQDCYTFFDGYVQDLYEQAEIYQFASNNLVDIINQFDNEDNLYNYMLCLEMED